MNEFWNIFWDYFLLLWVPIVGLAFRNYVKTRADIKNLLADENSNGKIFSGNNLRILWKFDSIGFSSLCLCFLFVLFCHALTVYRYKTEIVALKTYEVQKEASNEG